MRIAYLLLPLLCLLSSPAPAQEPGGGNPPSVLPGVELKEDKVAPPKYSREECLEQLATHRKMWRTFREESLMEEAVFDLGDYECPEVAQELLDLLGHRSMVVKKAAMKSLGKFRQPSTFEAFIAQLPELKEEESKILLIRVMANSRVKAMVPALQSMLGEKKVSAELKLAILQAFAVTAGPEVAPQVRPLLTDKNELLQAAACDLAAGLRLKELGPDLLPLLNHKDWQVQSAAIEAVGSIRTPDAVPTLVELLNEEGRVREEAGEALFSITALDFGVDPKLWNEQWTSLMRIGWRIPTDEELAEARATRKKYDALYGKTGDSVNTFGGIPTYSTSVLFIVDVSGSMDGLIVEREQWENSEVENWRKLTMIKEQLISTIDGLTKNTRFNILAFATDVDPWKKRPVSANAANRKAAIEWIRKLKAIGGVEDQELVSSGLMTDDALAKGKTNTYKALLYAFGMGGDSLAPLTADAGKRSGAARNPLDTVYFLSDGEPSVGATVDPRRILEDVTRLNKTYRMTIHCLAIGDFRKGFLQQLAMDNNGQFVDLGK